MNQKIHQCQVYWLFFFDILRQSYVINMSIPRKYCKILKEVKIQSGIIEMMPLKNTSQTLSGLNSTTFLRYKRTIDGYNRQISRKREVEKQKVDLSLFQVKQFQKGTLTHISKLSSLICVCQGNLKQI